MFNLEQKLEPEIKDEAVSQPPRRRVVRTGEDILLKEKYLEIQESDIQFVKRDTWYDGDGDSFESIRYEYKKTIAGYPYTFYLTAEDVKDEDDEYSRLGRIDFDIAGEKAISNIGLEQIHKTNDLIKDLFKFLYTKHYTKKLFVGASKSDIKLQDLDSLISEIQIKVDNLKSRELVLEDGELVFGENIKGLKKIIIQGSVIELSFFSGEKEVISPEVFLIL